jgi:addiction module HigA family antidote
MSDVVVYKDMVAFHPGYYVAEVIEYSGGSPLDFATDVGVAVEDIERLIDGEIELSLDMAKKISKATNTSVEMWLNLQEEFDRKIIEIERAKDLLNSSNISI